MSQPLLFVILAAVVAVNWFFRLHFHLFHKEMAGAGATRAGAKSRKWALAALFCLFCGVAGLLLILDFKSGLGSVAMIVAGIFAVFPVPFHVALIYWVDRMEPEPPKLIWASFFWGATAAVLFSGFINDLTGIAAAQLLEDQELGSRLVPSFVAPVVEESAKGAALLALFLWRKEEFNDIVDGMLYAVMVALGFAMTENILYYGKAVVQGGLPGALLTFGLRGLLSPYSHPLFTSMTGAGFGLAAQTQRRWLKWTAPLAGFCSAIFFHHFWNSAASDEDFFKYYAFVMVPTFIVVLTLFFLSLRAERRILRQHLEPELRAGRLTQVEYEEVCGRTSRWRGYWPGLRPSRVRLWLLEKKVRLVAKELGLHRHRAAVNNPGGPEMADREAAYIRLLEKLRAECAALGAPFTPVPPIITG